jgi:hypothetical protein
MLGRTGGTISFLGGGYGQFKASRSGDSIAGVVPAFFIATTSGVFFVKRCKANAVFCETANFEGRIAYEVFNCGKFSAQH